MIWPRSMVVAALSALCLQPARAEAPRVPLAAPATLIEMTIDKRSVVVIAFAVRDVGGRIGVCGALWPKAKASFAMSRKSAILNDMIVEVRGRPVGFNGGTFPVLGDQAQAEREGLRCSVSRVVWAGPYAEDEIVIRQRSGVIRE